MKKKLLTVLIVFLSFVNVSFANCCPQGLTATNGQKACQNIFSFLAIDFSFLSPRATAADVHVCGLKHGMHRCKCEPQCCPDSPCCPCVPQCCPCQQQNCPCPSQSCPCHPQCNQQSMVPTTDENEIPVSDKKMNSKQCSNKICPSTPKSMFRLDLFRTFKIQIL